MESVSDKGVDVDTESLSAELSKGGHEAREIQRKLLAFGKDKLAVIRQLREVNPELNRLASKISELKASRDRETALVREFKAKRDRANADVKLLSPEMKNALDAKESAIDILSRSKAKGRKSASQLYSELEALEMKIITEAMPFNKEKEIMKIVHEKRKQLEAVKAFSEAMKSHRDLFFRFSELRKQSFAFHSEVQKHAAESQKFHEELMAVVARIHELRQKKKALVEYLGKVKGDYSSADSELQKRLGEVSEAKKQLEAISALRKKEAEEKKERELTSKLKSGKKLTASDLMALQGSK